MATDRLSRCPSRSIADSQLAELPERSSRCLALPFDTLTEVAENNHWAMHAYAEHVHVSLMRSQLLRRQKYLFQGSEIPFRCVRVTLKPISINVGRCLGQRRNTLAMLQRKKQLRDSLIQLISAFRFEQEHYPGEKVSWLERNISISIRHAADFGLRVAFQRSNGPSSFGCTSLHFFARLKFDVARRRGGKARRGRRN